MKIAVWSPTPFAGRKSTHLLLLALQAIAEEGGEQLVLHADYEGSGPEHFLLSGIQRNRMIRQKEFGIELLCRLLHCERFSKEMAVNSSYSFAEGKLHILPPGNSTFYRGREQEAGKAICTIMQFASRTFQNVWVELPAGDSELSEQILSEADCVIVNLAQSPCEAEKIGRLPQFEHAFYMIGAYEQRSIYAMHNMKLLFPELRGRCAAVPYHAGFLAACCAGDVERFWVREISRRDTKEVPAFFCAVEKAYEKWKEGGCAKCGEEKG
ncbi:MAG: hypothetical protein PUC73_11895 [Lachnospiraceae bacterium]|nr:hypothetical protein [Lachnospiraceae bacterium]